MIWNDSSMLWWNKFYKTNFQNLNLLNHINIFQIGTDFLLGFITFYLDKSHYPITKICYPWCYYVIMRLSTSNISIINQTLPTNIKNTKKSIIYLEHIHSIFNHKLATPYCRFLKWLLYSYIFLTSVWLLTTSSRSNLNQIQQSYIDHTLATCQWLRTGLTQLHVDY